MQETSSQSQGSRRPLANRPRSTSADAILAYHPYTVNSGSHGGANAASSAGTPSQEADRETSGSRSLESDVEESELDAAVSSFRGALKDLKFALAKPALPYRTKHELRALCSTVLPAQTLLFQYVHGTPEVLDSPEKPQLSDADEVALTEAVISLRDCVSSIMELAGDLSRMSAATAEQTQYAAYGEYTMFGGAGAYGYDYHQSMANRRKASQDLSRQIASAREAIRKETARLREILAKYDIKDSDPSDFSCVATPAVPMTLVVNLPEKSEPWPGVVARCINSITTAARDHFLPAGSQEDSTSESESESDSDTDPCRAPSQDRRRYRQLTHRYSPCKTFRNEKKQLDYHREAEQSFLDLQAKLSEEHRNNPGASTATGQLLLNHKIETRVILHRRMQSQQMNEGSVEISGENEENSQASVEGRPQGKKEGAKPSDAARAAYSWVCGVLR